MKVFVKFLLAPALMIFACVLAGLYGAIHNQISYTVAPEYFHQFKFQQFGIPEQWNNRMGASLVGVGASWWMGILIGLPLLIVSLFAKGVRTTIGIFLKTASLVVGITLLVGLLALLVSFLVISDVPEWAIRPNITDTMAFARAGTMHNFSYIGGLVGLLTGLVYSIWTVRLSRRSNSGKPSAE